MSNKYPDINDELAAKYNIPQGILEWKKEIESELLRQSIMVNGKPYIKCQSARVLMRTCFTKGFKTARRNRNALAKYLLEEMEKRFIIKEKLI